MNYLKDHIGSIVVICLVGLLSIGSFFVDLNAVKDFIASAGIWAPVFYILTKASTVILAPLSGTALYVFSVPLFGFWKAITLSLIGDCIGAVVTFYLSRLFGRPVVEYFAGKKNMPFIEDSLALMATPKGFISMRLAAMGMPEIASYAAGLTSINFLFFICVHMIVGIIPVIVISLPGLFFTQNFPGWFMGLGIILIGAVTIVSIAIFVFLLKHMHRRNNKNKDSI